MPAAPKVPSTFALNGLMLEYASKLLLADPLTQALHPSTQKRLAQAVPLMSTQRQLAAVFEQLRSEAFRALPERAQLMALEAHLEVVLSPMEKLELEDALRDEFFRQVA